MPETAFLSALATEIHVWYAATDTLSAPCLTEQYLPLLDAAELHRYQRFHFDHDRYDYLAAHALVRISLSRYAEYAPQQWRFVIGTHGKPDIERRPDLPPLSFNLSHTKGMVACVIALTRDCGVDVERVRPVTDLQAMANMVCSQQEMQYLESLPEADWPQNFFKLWTLKEAYIKALGLGFSAPLRQITFDITNSAVNVHSAEHGSAWLFDHCHPTASLQLAVAARQTDQAAVIVRHQFDLTNGQYKRLA